MMNSLPRAPPRRRQADSTETSPSLDASAETTSALSAGAASDTSLITSSTSLTDATASSSLHSSTSSDPASSSSAEDPPQHTSTATTAYTAHGVNATRPAPTTTDTLTTSPSSYTTTSTTSSKYVDPAASALASAKGFGIPPNELTACEINGTSPDNGPFCSPLHQQRMWAGFTYAITWNPSLFARNASNVASFDYVESSLGNAWKSDPIPNSRGYVNIQMEKDWLKGASGNDSTTGRNMTLHILSTPAEGEEHKIDGPLVALIINPKLLPKYTIKDIPNKYGLEIGLPIGLVAIFFILLGVCCGIRKNNRHHRSIRGVSKDYMAKRARRRGDIPLEEYGGEGYQDQPVKGGNGNAFRDEISKQRQEDDSSLRRFPSSY